MFRENVFSLLLYPASPSIWNFAFQLLKVIWLVSWFSSLSPRHLLSIGWSVPNQTDVSQIVSRLGHLVREMSLMLDFSEFLQKQKRFTQESINNNVWGCLFHWIPTEAVPVCSPGDDDEEGGGKNKSKAPKPMSSADLIKLAEGQEDVVEDLQLSDDEWGSWSLCVTLFLNFHFCIALCTLQTRLFCLHWPKQDHLEFRLCHICIYIFWGSG